MTFIEIYYLHSLFRTRLWSFASAGNKQSRKDVGCSSSGGRKPVNPAEVSAPWNTRCPSPLASGGQGDAGSVSAMNSSSIPERFFLGECVRACVGVCVPAYTHRSGQNTVGGCALRRSTQQGFQLSSSRFSLVLACCATSSAVRIYLI